MLIKKYHIFIASGLSGFILTNCGSSSEYDYSDTLAEECTIECAVNTKAEIVDAKRNGDVVTFTTSEGDNFALKLTDGFSSGGFRAGGGFNDFKSIDTSDLKNEKNSPSAAYTSIDNSTAVAGIYLDVPRLHRGTYDDQGNFIYLDNGVEAYAFLDKGDLASLYNQSLTPENSLTIENINIMIKYTGEDELSPNYFATTNRGSLTVEPSGTFTGGSEQIGLSLNGVVQGQDMTGTVAFDDMTGELEGFIGASSEKIATIGVFTGKEGNIRAFSGGWSNNDQTD